MSEAAPDIMAGNPFSTRSIRPGRIPPLDGSGSPLCVAEMLVGLERCGGSAALVAKGLIDNGGFSATELRAIERDNALTLLPRLRG